MNWYVKYGGTGEVSGPMDKEEALAKAMVGDGMAFNERIFEPEFATSEEVTALIKKLDGVLVGALREEASRVLILLSAKKRVSGSIEGGVLDISEVSPGVEVVIHDYDIQEVDTDRLSTDKDGRDCVTLEFGG